MLALVESVFAAGHASLADLSAASMEALADSFEVMPETVLRSSEMAAIEGGGSERVLAICRELGAKRYVTGQGAADYLDHAAFDEAGIAVEYMDYEKRATHNCTETSLRLSARLIYWPTADKPDGM